MSFRRCIRVYSCLSMWKHCSSTDGCTSITLTVNWFWKNGWLNWDAIWGDGLDRPKRPCIRVLHWVQIPTWEGAIFAEMQLIGKCAPATALPKLFWDFLLLLWKSTGIFYWCCYQHVNCNLFRWSSHYLCICRHWHLGWQSAKVLVMLCYLFLSYILTKLFLQLICY